MTLNGFIFKTRFILANCRENAIFKRLNFLDIATGTGDLAIDAVNMHPEIKATGLDFVQNMIDYGTK